mgnify:FL=1|jgi:hypothetical protein
MLQIPCQAVQLEMAIMKVQNALLRAEAIKASVPANTPSSLTLGKLFLNSGKAPMTLFKPSALSYRRVEPGKLPLIDQTELYVEVFRESFEVSPEDDVGLDIEVRSDFLLSGVNVAINNVATG